MWGRLSKILSVVPKDRRADIIDASLNSSYLWHFFTILHLKENMRLINGSLGELQHDEVVAFDKWLLQIRNGSNYNDVDKELVKLPADVICKCSGDPIASITKRYILLSLKNIPI